MVPFFGSSVKQRTVNLNSNESVLDNYNGTGSQVIHKREQAPFAPQENYTMRMGHLVIPILFSQE